MTLRARSDPIVYDVYLKQHVESLEQKRPRSQLDEADLRSGGGPILHGDVTRRDNSDIKG